MFWANKDHVANLVATKGEEQSFYFLIRNMGRDKVESAGVLSGKRNQSPESHFSDLSSFIVL
jgi:hypothetical protein